MAQQLERALRITTLISNLIALPLVIPAGIESSRHSSCYYCYQPDGITIYFGFIPLAFSIFAAIFYLVVNRARTKEASAPKPRPLLWLAADVLIFSGYLTVLVLLWLREPEWLYNAPRELMFEAYATMPYIVTMFIHAFLVLLNSRYLVRAIAGSGARDFFVRSFVSECPHCHHQIRGCDQEAGKGNGEGYRLLRGEDYDEDAGRASEETAGERSIADV